MKPIENLVFKGGGVLGAAFIKSGRTACAAISLLVGTAAVAGDDACAPEAKSAIDYAMYFLATPKDHEACAMSVMGEGDEIRLVPTANVSNAAMSCPDMFSWKLFAEVTLDRWWSRWADEGQNWPAEPYPLCADGQTPGTATLCCKPGSSQNDPGHCPVFPGDAPRLGLLKTPASEPVPQLRPSFGPGIHGRTRLNFHGAGAGQPESVGRVIRQDNNEYTVRNEVFHDFLFRNNLYNSNGLIDVFNRVAHNVAANAPYHRASASSFGDTQHGDMSRIDLPPASIMIKSNWVNPDVARKLGIKENPDFPFIKKKFRGNDNRIDTYWLVAFHISSKDIPNWVWATFEHVAMPGRCDLTGCNDAYGYAAPEADLPEGAANNYVAPHTRCDNLVAKSKVFDRDRLYAEEEIRPGLKAVFKDLGIGTAKAGKGKDPAPSDRAWLSYRLKGSQVDFTDATGVPTVLGNSVTEAGFMHGSSCITCHARAGIDELGPIHSNLPDRGVFPLSVFINEVGDYGYGLSARGAPNPAWYYESNTPPRLRVLQTDFVWGFLNARPIVDGKCSEPATSASVDPLGECP